MIDFNNGRPDRPPYPWSVPTPSPRRHSRSDAFFCALILIVSFVGLIMRFGIAGVLIWIFQAAVMLSRLERGW